MAQLGSGRLSLCASLTPRIEENSAFDLTRDLVKSYANKYLHIFIFLFGLKTVCSELLGIPLDFQVLITLSFVTEEFFVHVFQV